MNGEMTGAGTKSRAAQEPNSADPEHAPVPAIALRVRRHWEALDLGVLMVREQWQMLYGSWLLVSALFFGALAFAAPGNPPLAIVLLWWLKPLFERLPLALLSRTVFGERPSFAGLLRSYAGTLLRSDVLASIVWLRFSPTRSMDAPVTQLEGAHGRVRSNRTMVLRRRVSREAFWLTLTLFGIEIGVTVGLYFVYRFLGPDLGDGRSLFNDLHSYWVMACCYYLAWSLVGPVYSASGFSLYLNRRCELEGWDLEVGFRRMIARLGKLAMLATLATASLLVLPQPAFAAEGDASYDDGSYSSVPRSEREPDVVDASVSPGQSKEQIKGILGSREFHDTQVLRYPKFLKDWFGGDEAQEEEAALPDWLVNFLEWVARFARWIIWVVVLSLAAWLIYRYRDWLRDFGRDSEAATTEDALPVRVAGIELRADELPADPVTVAEALWQGGDARGAVGLLYRATLTALISHHGCRFREGDTEEDCRRAVQASQPQPRATFFANLVGTWQSLAYAHRTPDEARFRALLDAFRPALAESE